MSNLDSDTMLNKSTYHEKLLPKILWLFIKNYHLNSSIKDLKPFQWDTLDQNFLLEKNVFINC